EAAFAVDAPANLNRGSDVGRPHAGWARPVGQQGVSGRANAAVDVRVRGVMREQACNPQQDPAKRTLEHFCLLLRLFRSLQGWLAVRDCGSPRETNETGTAPRSTENGRPPGRARSLGCAR